MAEPDEKDLDAAERALGTERRDGETAEERRARQEWDGLLAPLGLAAPPAEPPADMFERISKALDGETEAARIVQLAEHRARRWRAVALAASGIAACLMVVVAAGILTFGDTFRVPPGEQNYVALVTQQGGGGPAMIVEVDIESGTATVRSLQVEAPEGRALELWRIPPGGTPRSLGLVDPDLSKLTLDVSAEPGDTLAITVEPPGGAPGGTPSGPPILSGPLIPVD